MRGGKDWKASQAQDRCARGRAGQSVEGYCEVSVGTSLELAKTQHSDRAVLVTSHRIHKEIRTTGLSMEKVLAARWVTKSPPHRAQAAVTSHLNYRDTA